MHGAENYFFIYKDLDPLSREIDIKQLSSQLIDFNSSDPQNFVLRL
jgi:hypothetical protein